MTNRQIPCEMIQDILPLYAESLTSEVTNREVEEHLADCEICRENKERLMMTLEQESNRRQQEGKKEIDYLKKVRRRGKKNIAVTLGVVFALFLVCMVKVFVIGSPSENFAVLFTNVYEDRVEIGGMCYNSAMTYRDYKVKTLSDGSTKLVIYTALPSVVGWSGNFTITLDLEEIGTQIQVGDVTVKADGTVIGGRANAVYGAKNPYVGDMVANGRLVQALGLTNVLGGATNELQTVEEPYGWTLHFTDAVRNSLIFDEQMRAYACVLIAMTENLSEVRWTYTVELSEGAVVRENSITAEECSDITGADIKSFAESPEKVQELLDILGIK